MPARILSIAQRHLNNPARVIVAREKTAAGKLPRVRQIAYIVPRAHKPAALDRVLDMENPTSAIVFCRTRLEVETLVETLNAHGRRAQALHGGMEQRQRDRVMQLFRGGKADLLIATDVAARGLDIEHLSHVFNYDVPPAAEAYVHRIGRTGRAGREGTAITLAEPREHRMLRSIESFTKQKIDILTVPTVAELRSAAARRHARVDPRADPRRRSRRRPRRRRYAGAGVRHRGDRVGGGEAGAPGGGGRRRGAGHPGGGRARAAARRGASARTGRRGPPKRFSKGAVVGPAGPREQRRDRPEPSGEVAMLFVGAGREAGIRPGDLVGAITGEAGINSRELGAIQIADRFSLVEVPAARADEIIAALKATTIRGRKVPVRRDRDTSR